MKLSDYNQLSKADKQNVKFKDQPVGLKIITILVAIAIIIGIGTCVRNYTGANTRLTTTNLANHGQNIAQNSVKALLKSPLSAVFSDEHYKVSLTDSTVYITGYVDSQNSFGAMLRGTYIANLKYIGGDMDDPDNWIIIQCTIN